MKNKAFIIISILLFFASFIDASEQDDKSLYLDTDQLTITKLKIMIRDLPNIESLHCEIAEEINNLPVLLIDELIRSMVNDIAISNGSNELFYKYLMVICEIGRKSCLSELEKLKENNNEKFNILLKLSLYSCGNLSVTNYLNSKLTLPVTQLKIYLAAVMSKNCSAEAKLFLIQSLNSSSEYIRAATINSIGKLNNKSLLDEAVMCLDDSSELVRIHVIEAIKNSAKKEYISLLKPILCDPSDTIKFYASSALDKLEPNNDRALLHNLLLNGDYAVALKTFIYLTNNPKSDTEMFVIKFLEKFSKKFTPLELKIAQRQLHNIKWDEEKIKRFFAIINYYHE